MRISTKKGDKGFSSLTDGIKLKKSAEIFEVLGSLDELNSFIGWAKVTVPKKYKPVMERIQKTLYEVMADVASVKKFTNWGSEILFLEKNIDELEKKLGVLRKFLILGKNEASSRLHIARTVCRRRERIIVKNFKKIKIPIDILVYMNRLSDLLFLMAEKF